MITQEFDINIIPHGLPPHIAVNQYDEGLRTLIAHVYQDGVQIPMESTYTYSVVGTKPSGTGFIYPATVENGAIVIDVTGQMTVVAGAVRCGVLIQDGDDVVGTLAFVLDVQLAALTTDTIIDSSEFGTIITDAVVEWMDEHGVPIDSTLSQEGMAAEAKAVGDRALLAYPILITNSTLLSEVTGGANSANSFPVNSIINLGAGASAIGLANYAMVGGSTLGMYITLNYSKTGLSGRKQIFINGNGIAIRSRGSSDWSSWIVYQGDAYAIATAVATALADTEADIESKGLYLGRYSTIIVDAPTLSDLTGGTNNANDIPVNKIIYVGSTTPDFTNMASVDGAKGGLYITLSRSNNKILGGNVQVFLPAGGGIATRISTRSGSPAVTTWSAWHYVLPEMGGAVEYHVGASRTGGAAVNEFTGLTDLWCTLNGDTTNKIVYVAPGEYDVYAEYRAAQQAGKLPTVPDSASDNSYSTYCANIPSNTTIIGLGEVVLKWTAVFKTAEHPEGITYKESRIWSPVNVDGTNVHIENITVTCKNGRYCIHDDPHNNYPGGSITYKSVTCYKYINDVVSIEGQDTALGFSIVQGMGYCDKGRYEFDNCRWYNEITGTATAYCIGGHEGATRSAQVAYNGATVVFRNCVMVSAIANAMRFQTINAETGAQQRIQVSIDNCYLSGGIWLDQGQANAHQFFDLTLVNSGNPTFTIDIGAANPYPPKVYNS